METTLDLLIRDNATLSEAVKANLLATFGAKCRADTKARLRHRLDVPLALWSSYRIYSRVFIDPEKGDVYYCAGQSYPDEVRLIRQLMLRG